MRLKETIIDYNLLAAWKVDDKNWVKQRRMGWKMIQIQLDRMREAELGSVFHRLPKKNYKYLKSYYMTGRDKPETRRKKDIISCLAGYDLNNTADVLLQFWLSADHSKEYLSFLKDYLEQNFDKRGARYSKERTDYEKSVLAYRNTICHYSGTKKYKWEDKTTEYNGSIFGDLEPEMLSLFALTPRLIADLDERVTGEGKTGIYAGFFEYVLAGYFGSEQEKHVACFNPHNPIQHMLDEYERWGVPAKRRDIQDRRPFLISTALAWYVVDTPEGRHSLQVDVAQELKQRILDIRKKAPNEVKERIGEAIKLYETGGFKQFL